ncbi:Zinc/cadmium resistance protein [Leucoagaricus sp. SymC.cos]|nr:Zinc/cadmium resistance protein [Leucoagaricus sp. SymC.cos]
MKNTTRIGIVLGITFAFFGAEIAGKLSLFRQVPRKLIFFHGMPVGFKTKSLAVIADAFHYFNDVVAYSIAFIAAYSFEFTFAFHRAELVGAFFNGVFLLALALSIFLQSIERFVNIQTIEDPFSVLIVGCVGLGLNILNILVVHDHHGHEGHTHGQSTSILVPETSNKPDPLRDHLHATHNHTIDPPGVARQRNLGLIGVFLHILGDAFNNIGVIIAATIMWKVPSAKSYFADPTASLVISLIISASAIPMTLKSGRILLEATPLYLDLAKVKEDLLSIPNVLSVHDLHVWHLSQSVILASLHICVPVGTSLPEWEQIEQTLQHCLQAYGISHTNISPELWRFESQPLRDLSVPIGECNRLSSQDDFGCAINGLKKRKLMGGP